jgi:cell division transport system permease protein
MRPKQRKRPLHYLRSYLMRHCQAAINSIGQISRAPVSALMTCTVIGIALALPMGMFVLLKNVEVLSQQFRQSTQMTVYIKPEVTASQVTDYVRVLQQNPDIINVISISPSQALQELEQQSGAGNLLADLQANPLPWSLIVTPANAIATPHALSTLSHGLQASPLVDSVQLDEVWVERLFSLITIAHRAIYALALFLGIGVLLIVNNCIRSATQANKKEIDVIKLIGGTHAFIRRPFLYTGLVYGLLGGIIAWQLVDFLLLWLKQPVEHLASLYNSSYQLLNISLGDTFSLLISGLLLGWAGSWIAVTRFLKSSKS